MCDGALGHFYREYRKNGYIVKVMGERKTVYGTAWYQLNHATVIKNVKRFHCATWFGVVSYRKMNVAKAEHKRRCPICNSELVKLRYMGFKHFINNRSHVEYVRDSYEDFYEDGIGMWEEEPDIGWKGGYR